MNSGWEFFSHLCHITWCSCWKKSITHKTKWKAEEMRLLLWLPCSNYTALQGSTADKGLLSSLKKLLILFFLISSSPCHSSDMGFFYRKTSSNQSKTPALILRGSETGEVLGLWHEFMHSSTKSISPLNHIALFHLASFEREDISCCFNWMFFSYDFFSYFCMCCIIPRDSLGFFSCSSYRTVISRGILHNTEGKHQHYIISIGES